MHTKVFHIRLDEDDSTTLEKMGARFDMSATNLAKLIVSAGIKALSSSPGRLVLPLCFRVFEPEPDPVLNEKIKYPIKRS
jgi:hypothetical protein